MTVKSLQTITLPRSLKEIGIRVFYGCNRLLSVGFADGYATDITMGDVWRMYQPFICYYPYGCQKIEREAFGGCLRLQEITIGSNVDTIEDAVFSGCNQLQLIKDIKDLMLKLMLRIMILHFESIGNVKETLQLRNIYCEWQYKEHSKVNIGCTSNKDGYYYTTYVEKRLFCT